jgi:hypothetical protein
MPFMIVAVAAALATSACGSSGDQEPVSSSGTETEALEERIKMLESEAEERDAEAARELKAAKRKARAAERKALRAKRARERAPAEADAEPVAATGGEIVVPEVVGLDHQAAQDAMQGEGLWILDEKDCSGQGRMLLWDRNWEVVRTDPPAGTRVTEDTTITLCSVKDGE